MTRAVALGLLISLALIDPLGFNQSTPVQQSIPVQTDVSDAVLERASGTRTVTVGTLPAGGAVSMMPLEVYVARVLAGEAEPGAADAAQQALAVAIRTYAAVNAGRHRREGFDLCDTTHCQVVRTANDTSRRAALATAGRVLTLDNRPVEIFYSASCGGRSESAAAVWPGGTRFPYLKSIKDDVHEDDVPWVLDLTLDEIRQALSRAGFGGERLRDVDIDERTQSGRVARLHLSGLRPNAIAGDPFRMAIGARQLRSTAFSITKAGNSVRFTGLGYGHGVGMCVIGAGRRARRGETVEAILAQYFPGLAVTTLDGKVSPIEPDSPVSSGALPMPAIVATKASGIIARVPTGSAVTAGELEQLATRVHESLSRVLGTSASSVTVELHSSVDGFRYETGRPWWVSAAVTANTIDLMPAPLLAQRDGMESALRTAMAELLVSPALTDRPAWVRVGAARYFSRLSPPAVPSRAPTCPADAELTMALSAVAQREAEARAERCFAHELSRTGDWRTVR